jgi:hypothetical protein
VHFLSFFFFSFFFHTALLFSLHRRSEVQPTSLDLHFKMIEQGKKRGRQVGAIGILPAEIIVDIISYSAGSIEDLVCGGAVSKVFCAASKAASRDGNEAIWEQSFRSRDAVLHRSLKSVPQIESTQSWRDRLRHLAKVEPIEPYPDPVSAFGLQLKCADIVLHRHPTHGFLLHLSEFRGTVVVYALRASPFIEVDSCALSPLTLPTPGSAIVSATKTKLNEFHSLPDMLVGHRPRAPAANLLLVRGVNGWPIHSFHNLAGLLACARSAGEGGELCQWQFMECPAQSVKTLPKEYRLASSPIRL